MSASKASRANVKIGTKKPSEEFADFCEAEYERRLNMGETIDERRYRNAMSVVIDRLVRLEDEARR